MSAPPIAERHLPHFHRRAPVKEAVRAATTANITIATALNNGDSLDGLTLATGDRVLVKDQSSASGNGIYTVGATPARDYDESTDDPAFGYLVYVREGTTNGGTLWRNTNTSTPTVGSTSLTFSQFTSGAVTEITDLPTSETDTALVLHPDGAGGVEWGVDDTGGGGGSTDSVATVFGTPDTAYEFTSSSLAGLTALGSPTTEDANTTIADALYYKDATSTTAWMGRYQASPTAPFTAITKLLDWNPSANFNGAGILVGVASPGAFVTCEAAWNGGRIIVGEKFTNRTTFSSSFGTSASGIDGTIYLGVVVNSTTSIDYYWSFNGWVWRKFLSASNPSLTVGMVGIGMKSEAATGHAVAFDYLRIWNSAKTFPS